MKQADIPAPSKVHDALVYGVPGDYKVKVNGQPLETRQSQVRRFATADAAVKTLARHGINGLRVEIGLTPAVA
ncbi:hypothetical protein QU487_13400 [Crenobacter sp. SG2305]|uniref:hypothetical protein n=1 Tax=Crenobacter oryzisoli TaxID=3056844 RepID=UPI0025AAA7E7|nr:hypothetical protein [Crenobacter sp. SG2305]MDN0083743.1 hypothetical protein [Crenobacter sp. SG2305]